MTGRFFFQKVFLFIFANIVVLHLLLASVLLFPLAISSSSVANEQVHRATNEESSLFSPPPPRQNRLKNILFP